MEAGCWLALVALCGCRCQVWGEVRGPGHQNHNVPSLNVCVRYMMPGESVVWHAGPSPLQARPGPGGNCSPVLSPAAPPGSPALPRRQFPHTYSALPSLDTLRCSLDEGRLEVALGLSTSCGQKAQVFHDGPAWGTHIILGPRTSAMHWAHTRDMLVGHIGAMHGGHAAHWRHARGGTHPGRPLGERLRRAFGADSWGTLGRSPPGSRLQA